jgi:hypothetical protein
MGAVCYQRLGCPDLGVSTSGFEPLSLLLGHPGVGSTFIGCKDVQGGFEELQGIVARGRQRNRGFSRENIRDVLMPPRPLQSISFLSRTR